MKNNRPLTAHLSMFLACSLWGLMAPIAKDDMAHGITGLDLVTLRVVGATALFWLASLFAKREYVPVKDRLLFAGAGLLGIVTNQCLYNIGLSITSPINASIVTTSLPIFAMVLSFFILKEPITAKKLLGVLTGCCGAVILIMTSAMAANAKVGNLRGDLMCLCAQASFALYLSLFNKMVRRYSVFTVNKWMFLWAAIFVVPFTSRHITSLQWSTLPMSTWLETAYVVCIGTFVCYLLTMVGQKTLRPTVVAIYNYLQPIVSVTVSVLTGIGAFRWSQGLAVVLVVIGVSLVTKSKSLRDVRAEKGEETFHQPVK